MQSHRLSINGFSNNRLIAVALILIAFIVTRHAGLRPTCRITAVSLGAPPAPPTMKMQMHFHSKQSLQWSILDDRKLISVRDPLLRKTLKALIAFGYRSLV